MVGPPLAGAPQESGGWSATGGRPSGDWWLVRHWRAPLRRPVVGPPLAGTPQKSGGWSATGGQITNFKKKQFDPPANLLTQCHFVLQAIHDGKHR